MPSTRRSFLVTSALAGAAAVSGTLGRRARASEPAQGKGLKILILGGTGFLGPHVVDAATARGHTLTLFNRGVTEKRKGGMFPDLEKLVGDRDPDKGEGLKALEGRTWDAVVDTSAYFPRMVRASAGLLAPSIKHYVLISTISVYADNSTPGGTEDATLGTMPDPTLEQMGEQMQFYGPLKALCEQAAEEIMPGRVTTIRPGFIVGPGDPSDRFTYWPVRMDRAKDERAEVLCPGTAADPVQFIDGRDLAAWIVKVIEDRTMGIYNATGPGEGGAGVPWGGVIDACVKAAGTTPTLTWVESPFLAGQASMPLGTLPIWLPPDGETAGFHRWSVKRAWDKGLRFRSVEQTAADTLAWFKGLSAERQATLRAGPNAEAEGVVLKAWADRAK